MAVQSKENIIKFQVTIDDTILVKVFQSQTYFRRVKPGIDLVPMDASDKILVEGLTVHVSNQTARVEYVASGRRR
jgi:hypothetical protein